MTLDKARVLLKHSRSNIGRCLRMMHSPRDSAGKYYQACRELAAAKADVKRLYSEYPELKPEKVVQTNLFN